MPETGNLSIYTFNLNDSTSWNQLSQDRNQDYRNGGRKIALLMCFDVTLSDDARLALEAAIQEKLANPKPEVKMSRKGFQQDGTYAIGLELAQSGVGANTADIYLSVGENVNALGEEVKVGESVALDASVEYAVAGLNKERTYCYRVRAVNNLGAESVAFGRLTDPVEATLAELGLVPQSHFDAANEFSFETNAVGEVIRWNGVENPEMDFGRWFSTQNGTNFGRRRLYHDNWSVYDMGDIGSGIDLYRVAQLTSKAVVMAVDMSPSYNAFFLAHTGSYHFHRGPAGEYAYAGTADGAWTNASGWENGTPVPGMTTSFPKTGELSVYMFNLASGATWNRLTQDRTCPGRNGGRQLGELMTFAENLTEEQRLALQAALLKKWRSQEAVTALWTGAAGDGNLANAGNWCCSNDLGEVTGVLPSDLTAVTFPGDKVKDIPVDAELNCKSIAVAGPFARDCDWRGVTAELVGSLDLNGHALHLAAVNGEPRFFGTDGATVMLTECPSTADDATGTVTMGGAFVITTPDGTGTLVLDSLTTKSVLTVLGLNDVLDCHYDASDAESFVFDDQGGVTRWRNLSRYYARDLMSSTTLKGKATRRLYQGRWVCDLGEVGSEIDLYLEMNGAFQSAVTALDIANDGDAFFWAHSGRTYHFHRGYEGQYAAKDADGAWQTASGWENGKSVSMMSDLPQTGSLSVYSFNLAKALNWDRVSDDRGIQRRNGGRKIGEMMLFTRQLSESERLSLEKVMSVKWRPRTPTTAVWTGAAGDDDFATAGNWCCSNDLGEVTGVLPMESTSVTLPDGWSMDIPAGTTFVCKDLTLNGSFTRDCDWRGLKAGVQGFLNLKGRKLQLPELKGSATIVSAQTAYRHYKFEILAPQSGSEFQISELKLFSGTADVTPNRTGIFYTGMSTGEKQYKDAFDGNLDTKWYANSFDANNPPTVTLTYAEPVLVTHYAWYTGDDTSSQTGRNLKDWRLSGSNDGTTWVTLDQCANVTDLLTMNKVCAFTGFAGSPDESVGEVELNIPADVANYNTTVSLGGALKLVKKGAGTFGAKKKYQGYVGGTYVTEGTCTMISFAGSSLVLGRRDSLIHVSTSAVFDINGQVDERVYRMVLDGGTLANRGPNVGTTSGCIGSLLLTANSYLDVTSSFPIWDKVDLNGYNLDIAIGSDKTLGLFKNESRVGCSLTNGTVNVTSGGCIQPYVKSSGDVIDARTVDFTVNAAFYMTANLNVRNLTVKYDYDSKDGSGKVNVYGVFTPSEGNYINNFVLQDGATLNLSNQTDAYNLMSPLTGKTLGFADGATIGVDVGERQVKCRDRLIAWDESTMPANIETLKFKPLHGSRCSLRAHPDGLYIHSGFVILFK